MTLDPTSLADALEAILLSMPSTPAAAAQALADAYGEYAQAATFGVNLPATLAPKIAAMKTTLQGAIANPLVGLPATFASAWASAVGAFWAAVAVAGPVQAGVTAGCPGAPALTGSLSTVFANPLNTAATCAAGMSAALHTATMTVTATVAPPPATLVPIA